MNENTTTTAMKPIQRIRTVLDAYKTPGSPLSKAACLAEIDAIVADVERIDRLTAVDDKLKVDILRASIVNIGRLLPDRMSIAFTRLDAVTILKQVFPDGETQDCVFTGHTPIYAVPVVPALRNRPRISNMDKDDILRKIEKCLALAKSSEPAEAAALRQAQALMREHGVSQLEAQAIGARECSVKAAARRAGTKPTLPALWPMLSAASSSLRAAESSPVE